MMRAVESSMLSEIGWADDTLYVRFHPTKKQKEAGEKGDLWMYKNYIHGLPTETPEEGWGRWFLSQVKGKYDGMKVEERLDGVTAEAFEEDW